MFWKKKFPTGIIYPRIKAFRKKSFWAGVPREFMILNFTMCISIAIMLRIYPFFIISLLLHFAAKRMTKNDPQFFKAMVRHLNEKRYFDV